MKQVVQQQRNGRLEVVEVPAPLLRAEGVLVQTAYSLISAGTERAKVEVARKNLVGKALARPDQVRQVVQTYRQIGLQATYQKVSSKLDALSPLGYSSAGVVLAAGAGAGDFAPGDRVACAGGGYASHAEVVYVPRNLCARVPQNVALDAAAYATVAAIALQGVRQAAPVLGDTVGVIGLGVVGLLTVQLLRAAGCRVIGFDLNTFRGELACRLGADAAGSPADPSVETLARRFSPAGLDAVILTAATSSDDPIRLAGRLARERARISVVGAVGMHLPRTPFYEKELEVLLSRSYGPGRYDAQYEEKGHDYPIGYVRWTEGRNMAACLDLMAQDKLDVKALTTHCFPLADAGQAYTLIQGETKEPYLGVLLEYGLNAGQPPAPAAAEPVVVRPAVNSSGKVSIALLGAGNFAQSMLLPHLRGHPRAHLRLVVTPGGLTARSAAERGGFELCAADPGVALRDPEVRLVVIASRHDSHSDLAIQALAAGKAVFVEKPLALMPEQLDEVCAAYATAQAPFLMVGYNRRFAPLVVRLREFMSGAGEPLLMHYRINAGHIPREHWTQDPETGGGRVVGEVCHFVDLLLHLAGRPPVEVYAYALPDQGHYNRDNIAAMLRFADGSAATLTYAANGDRGLEKERLEVFGGGRAAVLDDFQRLILTAGGKRSETRAAPDKGHRAEMQILMDTLADGGPAPIPFAEALEAARVTFGILAALNTGRPVPLIAEPHA